MTHVCPHCFGDPELKKRIEEIRPGDLRPNVPPVISRGFG